MHIITKIEQQKNNIRRYSIFLDGEYSFSVSEDTLVKLRLKKGMEIAEDKIEFILEHEVISLCKLYGLKLLSYKARSEQDIRDKMSKRGYSEKAIEEAIKYLRDQKYIDDEEFAKNYIRSSIINKKLGYNRIKNELLQKKVEGKIVEAVFDELIDNDDEYERALELAIKKRNTTYKNDDIQSAYRKLGGFLQRKGYSTDVVIKVLKEVLKTD